MNIFALSISPKQSAMYHGDKHVVKMLLETCQMLYTAHWFCGSSLEDAPLAKNGQRGYKAAHMNHPCTKWVRETMGNYLWAARLALALVEEYEYRWPGRNHSCKEHAIWLRNNLPPLPRQPRTPFAVAMDDEFKQGTPIASYRKFYIQSKAVRGLAVYTKRSVPWFLTPNKTLREA
jgi:uncharacterized CHY-type Zn-finger protein